MTRIIRIVAAAGLLLSAAAPLPALADPLVLEGEIQRGETLFHPFQHDGRTLELRLMPIGHGWSIWVGAPTQRDRNLVVATIPPYDGINPAVIQGWHFRNTDNTGPNKRGAGHVNAPGKTRQFAIVLDGPGYQTAQEALAILTSPEGRDTTDIVMAKNRLKAISTAPVTWEVQALELGNLIKGQQAWIDRMAFRLRIDLP